MFNTVRAGGNPSLEFSDVLCRLLWVPTRTKSELCDDLDIIKSLPGSDFESIVDRNRNRFTYLCGLFGSKPRFVAVYGAICSKVPEFSSFRSVSVSLNRS